MINRRTFLKLAGAGLLSLLLPIRIKEQMELSDVWAKLANQARLTPEELDFLKMQGRETQQRNAFVAGNTSPSGGLIVPFPFFPIYSEVLISDETSISVNIPGGYKHLFIVGQGRVVGSSVGYAGLYCRINSDTGANYQTGAIYQNGGVAGVSQVLDRDGIVLCSLADEATEANMQGSFFSYIPHYQSSYNKSIISVESAFGETFTLSGVRIGGWKNTSKINNLSFRVDTASVGAQMGKGSLISIYGIQ